MQVSSLPVPGVVCDRGGTEDGAESYLKTFAMEIAKYATFTKVADPSTNIASLTHTFPHRCRVQNNATPAGKRTPNTDMHGGVQLLSKARPSHHHTPFHRCSPWGAPSVAAAHRGWD
eukprot:1154210-Pelagomonas_calceolata.AAC.6